MVATVRQHGCMALAPKVSGPAVQRIRQTKDAERRDKMSMRTAEGNKARQKPVNLPEGRRCQKRHRWLV